MNDATRLDVVGAARRVLDADAAGEALAEVLVVAGEAAGRRLLLFEDGRRTGALGHRGLDDAAAALGARVLAEGGTAEERGVVASGGDAVLFAAAHRPADRMIVVGAGHIAVPLADLGVRLGFEVTVLDDREEFATPERFDAAVRVMRADFEGDPFANVRLDGRSYVALVTRGHRWDFDCLRRLVAVGARPRYIGMIGSRRRVRAAFHALLEAGVPRAVLAGIRAPIGLEVGAETPTEIAVSIAAEMIAVRRGVEIESLTSRERVLDRLLPENEESNG